MSEVFYFKRKDAESWAVISGEPALHNYRTDDKWEPISRQQFDREVAQPPFNVDRMTEAAGADGFAVKLIPLHPDDAAALAEPGAPEPPCPACGEIDCGQTCSAYAEPGWDGDECPHCQSTYTYRYGVILDEQPSYAIMCESCGKTSAVPIPPEAQS